MLKIYFKYKEILLLQLNIICFGIKFLDNVKKTQQHLLKKISNLIKILVRKYVINSSSRKFVNHL